MLLFRMNPAAKRKGCPTNVGPQDVESRTRCNERHCSICCHQINALTAVPLRKVISVRSLAFPRPTIVWLSTRLCTLPLVANPPQTRFYSLIPLTAPTFGRKKKILNVHTRICLLELLLGKKDLRSLRLLQVGPPLYPVLVLPRQDIISTCRLTDFETTQPPPIFQNG